MEIGFWTEFEELYTVQEQIELTALLGTSPDHLSYSVKEKIVYVACTVDSMLRQKDGEVNRKQIREALKVIEKRTRALLQALNDLDPDTRDVFQKKAILKFGFEHHILALAPRGFENICCPSDQWKESCYSAWLMHLNEIEITASAALEDFRKSGPPINENRLSAIRDLIQVWKANTKVEPTLSYNTRTRQTTGPFLQFCEIVLRPVFKANKTRINLERAVRDELYGRDRARKRRQ
jgi:hypothetical protein